MRLYILAKLEGDLLIISEKGFNQITTDEESNPLAVKVDMVSNMIFRPVGVQNHFKFQPWEEIIESEERQIQTKFLLRKFSAEEIRTQILYPLYTGVKAEVIEETTEEKIPGGLADGMTLAEIAEKHGIVEAVLINEYKKGLQVEMEHTTNSGIAHEIALDHLFEDAEYYTKLDNIESNE